MASKRSYFFLSVSSLEKYVFISSFTYWCELSRVLVLIRVGKITHFGLKYGKGFKKCAEHPQPDLQEIPPHGYQPFTGIGSDYLPAKREAKHAMTCPSKM